LARIDWFLLTLSYLCLFVFGLADNARGPTFPDMLADFALSDSLGSLVFLVASAASLANNLLSFFWLKRLGPVGALRFYSLVQALGVLMMGLARSYEGLVAASVVYGASSGALGIVVNLLAAGAVGPARRRQALSGLHCMYGVSSLLAPLLVSRIYAGGEGWPTVFLWLAAGPALVAVLSLLRKGGASHRRVEQETIDGAALGLVGVHGHVRERKRPRAAAIFFGSFLTLYVVAEVLVSTRLVLFARRALNYSPEEANLLLSAFFLALFCGRLLFAIVSFPFSNAHVLMLSAVSSLIAFVIGLTVHPLGLAVCGFTMSMFYPCAIALVSEDVGSHSEYATSWALTLQSCGLMVMHFGVGAVSDSFGIAQALWLGPMSLILVILLMALRPRVRLRFGW
jgi:FHS family glucose/mannose:H+ symporter-like MFS transporter